MRTEQRLETTFEATRKSDMPHWEGMAFKVRGQLHATRGNEEAARKDFDTAIEIIEKLERYIPPLQGRRSLLS